ncbi:MAG: hypothetical protein QOE45_760 [Frankiaceae bacterium]|nr:hypothetical protein [Frankiaceae bacterium]
MYGYFFAQTFSGNFEDVAALVTAGNLGVRFATPCYSGYALFAALEGTTGADLTTAAGRIVALGAGGYDVAVGTVPDLDANEEYEMVPPKNSLPRDHEAFCRVHLSSGSGSAFLAAAAQVDGVIGACLTAGAYGALVEVGADSYGELATALTAVSGLAGVTAQVTALAFLG